MATSHVPQGVISLVAGLLVVFNPNAAILTIAIFFGIWLLVSGIFTLIRGFGDTMETGARVLSIIVGALSIVLGIMCFRNIANAVELLRVGADREAPAMLRRERAHAL